MTWFYLDQSAISMLTQFVLVLVGTLYLLSLKNKSVPAWLLAGYMGAATAYTLLIIAGFLVTYTRWGTHAFYAQHIFLALQLMALLQFAYYFPHLESEQRREARLVLLLSGLVILVMIGVALYNLRQLRIGQPQINAVVVSALTALESIWVIVVLLRKTVRLSGTSGDASLLKTLLHLPTRPARATRAFALILITPLILTGVVALNAAGTLVGPIVNMVSMLAIIQYLFAFGIAYLNYAPEPSTFMVKLAGAALVTTLSVLGIMVWIVAPFYESGYRNQDLPTNPQTIRFEPNTHGSYTLEKIPYHFEADLGTSLNLGDEQNAVIQLAFPFSFYGQDWEEIHVSDNGLITFGGPFNRLRFHRGLQTTIAPLLVNLDPSSGGGIYSKNAPDKLVITWYQVPKFGSVPDETHTTNTFQLTLYPHGAFDISYQAVVPDQNYHVIDDTFEGAWLTGITSGNPNDKVAEIRLGQDYLSLQTEGIVEHYYADFRRYMHQRMLPFAYLIAATSCFILIGFPFFFQANLVRPLNTLVEGVRQVNRGDLGVQVPIHYSDEIGFLTQSFNAMVQSIQEAEAELRQHRDHLEELVANRTAALAEINTLLEQEISERKRAEATLRESQQQLEAAYQREQDIAHQIQVSLLPISSPLIEGLDIAGFSQPAQHVGGDFYNYFVFNPTQLGIAVGDVSGKGIQAALVMALSVGLLTTEVRRESEPASLLATLDMLLCPHTQSNKLNTALAYLTLDYVDGAWRLQVANAGLVAPLIRRADGELEWLDVGGLPLGADAGKKDYVEQRQMLHAGDILIISSDGIVEAMNSAGELYSFERFQARLKSAPRNIPAQAMQEWILRDVQKFMGQADIHDDLTLVVVVAS